MKTKLPNRIEWRDSQLNYKIEIIKNFVIEEHNDVVDFAKFLTYIAGFKLRGFDYVEPWLDIINTYHTKCDLEIADKHFEEFYADQLKDFILAICERLDKCVEIKGRKFVNDFLYIYTRKIEDERNRRYRSVHYMSGDEEARECNRQFNSMMDDMDAWGNLD